MNWRIFAVLTIFSFLHNRVASIALPFLNLKTAFEYANNIASVIANGQSVQTLIDDLKGQPDLSEIKDILLDRFDRLEKLVTAIPIDIRRAAQIDSDLNDMFKEMGDINRLYESYYIPYLNKIISGSSLQDFITKTTTINHENPDRAVTHIFNTICPGDLGIVKASLLDKLVVELNKHVCEQMKSAQVYILDLWNLIAMVELRAFVMVSNNYGIRTTATPEDNRKDIDRIKREHKHRMQKYLASVKNALSHAMFNVTHCSPTYNYDNTLGNVVRGNLRYFDLTWTRSDHQNNMVVTGVRYRQIEQKLHIQIEEGLLTADGKIHPGSTQWVPLEKKYQSIPKSERSYCETESTNLRCTELKYDIDETYYMNPQHHTCGNTNCYVVGVKLSVRKIQRSHAIILSVELSYASRDSTGRLRPQTNELSFYNNNAFHEPEDFQLGYSRFGTGASYPPATTHRVSYFDSSNIAPEPRVPITGIGSFVAPDSTNGNAASLSLFTQDLSLLIDTTE